MGLWDNSKQYYTKNMVHYEGNTYLAKKDNMGVTPIKISNDTWELMTIKVDTGYSINLQPVGDFSISKDYHINDLVNYKGNLYYCTKECSAIYPYNVNYWQLFLTGNGEILTNLKTDNKLSLVGAINETFDKIGQIINVLKTKYSTTKEIDNLYLSKKTWNEIKEHLEITLEQAFNKKLGKTEKAVNSEKLDGLDSLMFARSYSEANNDIVPREILNNSSHKQSYIGTISYATEVGLPCTYSKIIYMSHNTNGYGTQIAIPYDGGNYYGIYYRNATGTNWGAWIELLDTRERNANIPNIIAPDNNANNCLESGKAYYCIWNKTSNLPLGNNIDDGIIIPYMHIREQWGFQLYMTWHGTAIYWRKLHSGNWSKWYCIGGGSWNQEVIKDSEQVSKYLRWSKYGQNHVIFDASSGVTPSGRACNNKNPEKGWHEADCPTLMGFNGHDTYGVKVSNSGWTDGSWDTHNVKGFEFRNNNGVLEFLEQGQWKKVGGNMNYTVVNYMQLLSSYPSNETRFITNIDNLAYQYSGKSGILLSVSFNEIEFNSDYDKIGIYVKIDNIPMFIAKLYDYRSLVYYFPITKIDGTSIITIHLNLPFKNSFEIRTNKLDYSRRYQFGVSEYDRVRFLTES